MRLASLMRVRFFKHQLRNYANTKLDSIAGQMHALKTGGIAGAPPQKKKKKPVQKDESSDEESDTDGEEAEDTSETDTDTDEE